MINVDNLLKLGMKRLDENPRAIFTFKLSREQYNSLSRLSLIYRGYSLEEEIIAVPSAENSEIIHETYKITMRKKDAKM